MLHFFDSKAKFLKNKVFFNEKIIVNLVVSYMINYAVKGEQNKFFLVFDENICKTYDNRSCHHF